MVEFKRNHVKHNDRSIPVVMFDNCNKLEIIIEEWLGKDKTISENMGLLLMKLGIMSDRDDTARIYNFNVLDNSFSCLVNNSDIYNIQLNNLFNVAINPTMILTCGNNRKIYECISIKDIELGIRIIQREDSFYNRGTCIRRYLSTENVMFTVVKKGYVLEFCVFKPNDQVIPLFDRNGKYAKYELDNEDELIEYLVSMKEPLNIVSIYKDLCRISLWEVSQYPKVFIKLSKGILESERTIGLIDFNNGQLNRFGINIDNTEKVIFLDNNGNWVCECYQDNSLVRVYSNLDKNMTELNIKINGGASINMINNLLSNNIVNAYSDIGLVRKRVRTLFDSGKLINWMDMDSY